MKQIIITGLFLLISLMGFSQHEFDNWYFGWHCGMTFKNGAPVFLPGNPEEWDGAIGEASVSDSSGTLLFFSNGLKVYNRNKVEMPDGYGLLGGEVNCQVMAIQDISNHNLYYLFTVGHMDFQYDPDRVFCYSVIDMQLDGGKGDIVPGMKNIPLPMGDSAQCGLYATRHQNNRDVWVVVLRRGIPIKKYMAFLIDSSGVSHTPVVSVSTLKNDYLQQYNDGLAGSLRISPNGKYLFCTDSLTELCLFNTSTGVVTPKFRFWPGPGNRPANGQEFSIDSRYVYFTTASGPPNALINAVVQYDMINTDSSTFMNSRKVVGDSSGWRIQMAPDGKIYVSTNNAYNPLNRINNPSDSGISCNYQRRAFDLQGNPHFYCLPQFLQRYKAYIHSNGHCQNDPFNFSSDIWPPPDSIHWDFGDPASGSSNYSNLASPTHLFSGPGNFTVEMWVRHNDKRTDTSWVSVNVLPSPHPLLGNDTTVCNAESVTFDAGFCAGCTYRWTNLGSGLIAGISQTLTTGIAGVYEAVVTDTNYCIGRDTVQLLVDPFMPVSVTISASVNPVCTGTPVIFTATPINGGSASYYQWKVNGANIGANSPFYTYIPVNGDLVWCVLTSSEPCTSGNPASSIQLLMVVNNYLPVSVSVAASSNPFCPGSSVTFTATPANGGTSPQYQWKVNGANVGANSPVYFYAPADGDLIWCILTSSESCTSSNPASSIQLLMVVNNNLPAGITIAASANPFCPGSAVTFTATPVNGGSNPSYQWKVNGINAGTNSSSFSYVPFNNDSVWCVINSNLSCVSGNPASSAKIIMIGSLAPNVAFSACFDTVTTVNAKPFKLKGGLPLGGSYFGPGVNSSSGMFTPSVAGIGVKSINYSYVNVHDCGASKSKSIVVQPNPSFTCGSNLVDTRDNKIYPTVQIGTQCWLAANLDFGVAISNSIHQADNCIAEKYCYNGTVANCTRYGGLYQWDELMKFDDTPAGQGLCPPGWHIPTETEWTTLFNYYQGNSRASRPLQDTIINGFKALRSGVFYLNSSWSFIDFATIFWSSTASGQFKAFAHGMNSQNYSVSLYPASRANAFPVRCLKDYVR